ncbi:phenylalanine--tRNA ligase subunit beta [Gordonia jinhuaensis]|uniref:Phenylalanine--tRNA ligase beta subunit n=1 Tax=Gordonia jinhuaensis TaxID=1517702 RepID=A0A916TGX8_9ACTN|nr:phenylalanine--tRNA ligase subunit beta [Gordonia jinhuaensis]GGB42689.1 phenylalanine--tRNA ligase beta subunit [Gordonia jinhuaensis]
MRVPQSWLTEVLRHGDPQWSATTAQIDEGFVRVGFEIEDVEPLPEITGPLVIGRVDEIEELTGFKKPIRFCQVDVGEAADRGIVCGARNFQVGDLVVVALPGAVLPGGFAIAARQTYDHISDGMICSVSELGIGEDHSGILVLPRESAQPGADAREVLGLGDVAIDVNVTPDRGYAFSVRGLTRELASSFETAFVDPAAEPGARGTGEAYPVSVDHSTGATRYCAAVITGVDTTAVTPWWMRKRLYIAGMRPISPAVDVTNYVMLEIGQPLHAFDKDKLDGAIAVRRAVAGETLDTLDGVTRTLTAEDVVIADQSGPIALAGLMGGATTEVSDATTDIVLEAATFDQFEVFRSGKRHKLSTEASRRFERVVDPALPVTALRRAIELLTSIAGGTADTSITDVGDIATPASLDMPADLPDRTAGIEYPPETSRRRLEEVGCTVSGTAVLTVTPPTWRPDLKQKADLIEEVLRLEGLENIPPVVPRATGGTGLTPAQRRRRSIGKTLAADGFIEVLPYPFISSQVFDQWGLDAEDPWRETVRVLNPLESDRAELNTTLLPGLLEMMSRNISRGQRDLALYAIGQVVFNGPDVTPIPALPVDRRPAPEEIAALMQSLPAQPLHVAGVLAGLREPAGPWGPGRPADAADVFEAVRLVGEAAGIELVLRQGRRLPWHPGRCAEIVVDGGNSAEVVGWAGELHPAVLEQGNLPPRSCAFEIDVDALPIVERLPAPRISAFPPVLQDVAVVVDADVPAAAVSAALADGAGELLEEITLFDVFTGEQLGEGLKSLAFSLRFRAPDRTLTEGDANEARMAAVDRAGALVGARLR